MKLLFLSFLPIIFGYNIFDWYNLTSNPLIFHKCCDIDDKLLDTTKAVISHINSHDILNVSLHNEIYDHEVNNVNTICNYNKDDNTPFAYTLLTDSDEDIYVSDELLTTNNTLYNVVLHEFIHSLGLNHTETGSIMNYKIEIESGSLFYRPKIVEDRAKLYLSIDDMEGMKAIKKKYDDYIK